jgi:hypothetical protein
LFWKVIEIGDIGQQERVDVIADEAVCSAEASEEQITARLAVKKVEHPGSAVASVLRLTEQLAHAAVVTPECWINCGARGIAACPHALNIPEEQVRADASSLTTVGNAEGGEDTF